MKEHTTVQPNNNSFQGQPFQPQPQQSYQQQNIQQMQGFQQSQQGYTQGYQQPQQSYQQPQTNDFNQQQFNPNMQQGDIQKKIKGWTVGFWVGIIGIIAVVLRFILGVLWNEGISFSTLGLGALILAVTITSYSNLKKVGINPFKK